LVVVVECGGCDEGAPRRSTVAASELENWFRGMQASFSSEEDSCGLPPLPEATYPRCNWFAFSYPDVIHCEGNCCRGDYEEFGTGDNFLNFVEACFRSENDGVRLTELRLSNG